MFRILFLTISVWIWMQVSASAFRPNPTPKEIADLSRRIAADPGNSRNLQYRGLDYAVLGEKDKAIADYQAASKITPVNHYFFWSYGWALFDLGDYPSAIHVWESLAEENLGYPDIGRHWRFYTLALGYWGAGDQKQAFEFFSKAAKIDARLQDRDSFEAFSDNWSQKEQTMALAMFDAWEKEVEKPGSKLW